MRKLTVLLLLIFVSCFSAKASDCAGDSIGVTKVDGKVHIRYLVMPGETIYGLSTKFNVPISDLMEINPELVNGLKVGQEILVPYNPDLAKKEEEHNDEIYHVVQPGETLYSLSRKYDIPIGELMKMNDMDLKIGQKVVIGHKSKEQKEEKSLAVVKEQSASEKESEKKPQVKTTQESASKEQPKNEFVAEEKRQKKEEVIIAKEEPKKEDSSKVNKKNGLVEEKTQQVAEAEGKEEKLEVNEQVLVKNDEVEFDSPKSPSKNFSDEQYPFDPDMKQVLVIPFDPYLYFSDADAEFAERSNISSTKVRQVFRRRLNAMLRAPGYETIHLLGGKAKDSLSDINKIYSSVTYNYQEILYNPHYEEEAPEEGEVKKTTIKESAKSWLERQKEKITGTSSAGTGKAVKAKDNGKYFGVIIKNPEFFKYFNYKYDVDYYIFINQFEVKTNYENCLDRATQNYERVFITHFSIFDQEGNQIAGNKFNTYYHSNSNYIYQVVSDNVEKIAERILKELPTP